MKDGPDIARLGSLIGDPARANILSALMSGKALTATELASEAGITVQTVSSHLGKLQEADLIRLQKQGRHRYFSLSDGDVASVLESMMGLAAKRGLLRTRTGPKDAALRTARVCYNHLAGDFGVQLYDSLIANDYLMLADDAPRLTSKGEEFATIFGIELQDLTKTRRPLCKACLDWSSRRSHLAGALGTALLQEIYEKRWAKRDPASRAVIFSTTGRAAFQKAFPAV